MVSRAIGLTLAAALVASLAQPAAAQQFQRRPGFGQAAPVPCVLDRCVDGAGVTDPATPPAPRAPRAGTGSAPGNFDFYVLALSWSPGFCDTGGAAKAVAQCAEGTGLGFVVHGLWPQNTHGFPADCDGAASPSRAALDSVGGLYPDQGLARYEWRKHGTCTGLSPASYFAAVRAARDAVTVPPNLMAPAEPQTLAPLEVARGFVSSNPGLRTDMMAVTCRQDELEEVRLCFSKDLRGFTTCPEIARGACRTRQISVLPLR